MSKSDITLELENRIWNATNKLGVFGCFEVTIGWYGKERADYVTYDTKGIWRFYEVKSSKKDFYSKCKHSFYGHYNYFVMPRSLYEEVKKDIPDYIGVTDGIFSVKKAKKVPLTISSELLKEYLIRSLQREYSKDRDSRDISKLAQCKKEFSELKRENLELREELLHLKTAIRKKYGRKEIFELGFITELSNFVKKNDVDYSDYPPDVELINEVEKAVKVKIGKQLKCYLLEYGYLGFQSIEFYGVNSNQGMTSDLVLQNKFLHTYYEEIKNYIVIGNIGEGNYVLVNSNDEVYLYDIEIKKFEETGCSLYGYMYEKFIEEKSN